MLPISGTALQRVIQNLSSRLTAIEQELADRFTPSLVPQEVAVLKLLDRRSHLKMSAIGIELSIPLSTSTYLIDKSEKRKLVIRLRSTEDRRAVYVEPTAKGAAAATEMSNAQIALCDELLEAFGVAESAVLRQLLDRLTDNGNAIN